MPKETGSSNLKDTKAGSRGDDSMMQPPDRQPENPDSGLISDFNHEGTQSEMSKGNVSVIGPNVNTAIFKQSQGGIPKSGKYTGTY